MQFKLSISSIWDVPIMQVLIYTVQMAKPSLGLQAFSFNPQKTETIKNEKEPPECLFLHFLVPPFFGKIIAKLEKAGRG